jgi:uncharacterized Zn finger protein
MHTILALQGSENETYQVLFLHQDNVTYLACTCTAGAFGKLCRHKLAVLRGDSAALRDQGQQELLQQIQTCLAQSPLAALSQQLYGVQERLDLLDREAKSLKTAIELQIKNIRPNAKIWKSP